MGATATLGLLAAFALAVVSTLVTRAMARRFGAVDHPRADRWHHRATPTLGGVAIALGFSVPVLAVAPLQEVGPVLALALLATLLGLADDFRHLTPAAKLVGQTVLAAGALAAGCRLGWIGSPVADSLLTLLWLVGLTNAFNLLDNMDGLAAGVALIGASAVLMLAIAHGRSWDVVMLAAYIGATAGFLVFNFPPASIFMGDAGSLFLGFTLALLAVRPGVGLASGGPAAAVVPLAILSVPIFDTTLVVLVRFMGGRRILAGGRDHSSHRLVAMGLSERGAILALYACAGFGAIAGVSAHMVDSRHAGAIAALFLLGLILFGCRLAQVRGADG
jgi:UDP-GlcNAc:undecaprenyl-phosphate/decaprenyl-phosphate GlcNAc-1-phosphate transferase